MASVDLRSLKQQFLNQKCIDCPMVLENDPLLPCVLRFFLLSKKCQNPTVHYAVGMEAKLKTEDKKDPRYYLKIVQRIKRIVVKIWLKTLYEKAKLKTKDYWQHLKIFHRKKLSLKMSFAQIKKESKI